MKASFNELNLHDSTLLAISIDHTSEDVVLLLDYIQDYKSLTSSRAWLRFEKCVRISLSMNLDQHPPEVIEGGEVFSDSEFLKRYRDAVAHGLTSYDCNLFHFRLQTTFGSTLDFIAQQVALEVQ